MTRFGVSALPTVVSQFLALARRLVPAELVLFQVVHQIQLFRPTFLSQAIIDPTNHTLSGIVPQCERITYASRRPSLITSNSSDLFRS